MYIVEINKEDIFLSEQCPNEYLLTRLVSDDLVKQGIPHRNMMFSASNFWRQFDQVIRETTVIGNIRFKLHFK